MAGFKTSILILVLSMIFSILGSISRTEQKTFTNILYPAQDFLMLKMTHLINDSSFESLSCRDINLTIINPNKNSTIYVSLIGREYSRDITFSEKVFLTIKPPFDSYILIFNGYNSSLLVIANCNFLNYPFRYFSILSLIFFILGSILLMNSVLIYLSNVANISAKQKNNLIAY